MEIVIIVVSPLGGKEWSVASERSPPKNAHLDIIFHLKTSHVSSCKLPIDTTALIIFAMVEVGIPLQTEKKTFLHSFFIDLFAGGISGIAAKTASAPLDRIKLLMQTQKINRAIITPYKSSWDCAVRVYAEEGLSSFWRGNLANVYRYFPSQALNFAFKDQFKGIFVQDSFKDDLQYGKAKVITTTTSQDRTAVYDYHVVAVVN